MASMSRAPKRKSAYVRQQPKNNTPVHTEVLWGGGLWLLIMRFMACVICINHPETFAEYRHI